jgi:uncharacterized OB-fold protein
MNLVTDGTMSGGKCPKCSRVNFLDELDKRDKRLMRESAQDVWRLRCRQCGTVFSVPEAMLLRLKSAVAF